MKNMLAIYQSGDTILTFERDVEAKKFILRLRKEGQPEGEATECQMNANSAQHLGEIFLKHGNFAVAQEQ